jgi:sec-independent protein translocase protein TatA
MLGLGPMELFLILIIVLVIFGAGKLPQIGDALGKSIRNFKRSSEGANELDVTPKSGNVKELESDTDNRAESRSQRDKA